MGEKILILGCGYLGFNLANFLSKNNDVIVINNRRNSYTESNYDFRFFDTNLSDLSKLDQFDLTGYTVINALGPSSPTINIERINEDLKFYDILTKLFLYFSKKNIKRIIHISSGGTVYGNNPILPISENQILDPTNIYSLQKIFFEGFLKVNFIENNVPYTIMRISNPYGGYQILNKQQGLIPIVIKNIIQNNDMEFWADLNTVRDYIYISDLARAFEIMINKTETMNEIYNVGNGIGTTILEVIEFCQRVSGKRLKYVQIQNGVGFVNKNVLDITKLKGLGFSAEITLEEGIKKEYERIIKLEGIYIDRFSSYIK